MPKAWKRAELAVGGTHLSLLERDLTEPESGAPMLLLHGLVAEAETFRKFGDELPPNRRVVALDLPGAGFSERPEASDTSFAGIAALVREVMTALGMERPVLLGHSYGGAVALRLAVSSPELLNGLILISPAHPFSRREDPLVRLYLSPPGRLLAHLLPFVPRRVLLSAFRRMPGSRAHLEYRDIAPYLHTLRGQGTIAYLLRLLRSWNTDMADLAAGLERRPIALPTLLIWGEKDVVVPVATAKELLKYLQASELIRLPGVGHLPNEECSVECGKVIRAWLISRETAGETTG